MSDKMIGKISEMLNEEKWTRATLSSYSISNLKELDEIINESKEEGVEKEVKDLCVEHLAHTKNSIIALYLTGIISLDLQLVDDSNLHTLIGIFADNHKMQIVEFLCERILDFGENKVAIRTLANFYEEDSQEDKKLEMWERLIKVDYNEADIVKFIADKKEADGNSDEAIDYYKKAMHRFINKKLFPQIKDIWTTLISYEKEDVTYFFNIERKISTVIGVEKSKLLLMDLFTFYRDKANWDTCIEILKKILSYDSKDETARTALIGSYKNLYADNPKIEEFINLSNLNQNWRNVQEAIIDFEKHISFDTGAFVFHRTWGIGMIKSFVGDNLVIDFAKKRNHTMNLKMATTALSSLSKSHIWVLKSVIANDKLKERVKSDVEWTLKTLIGSFDNAASLKKIKSEIVPSILTQNEWNTWSKNAKKELMENQIFGNLPDQSDVYTVRQSPITHEEKLYNQFKSDKVFYNRIKVIKEFKNNSETDIDSEYFNDMLSYVNAFTNDFDNAGDQELTSYIFIRDLVKEYPYLNTANIPAKLSDIIKDKDKLVSIFSQIEDKDIKESFISYVKDYENWPEIYVKLFPQSLSPVIIEDLINAGKESDVQLIIKMITNSYREYRNGFIYLVKNLEDFTDYQYNYEKILINMINLLHIAYKEIENKQKLSENRKYIKNIEVLLFKEERVINFIKDTDSEQKIAKIFSIVNDIKPLDPTIKLEIKEAVIAKYPNFNFGNVAEVVVKEADSNSLIVLQSSIAAKAKELKYINEVEMPKNSKEIGIAIELGDLKENAEYKAAKEKQTILSSTMEKLQGDIERATIFNEEEINTSEIGFATVVELENKVRNVKETFTILGPWESNPNENIISYLSPLGQELSGGKKDEVLEFVINGRKNVYKILNITACDLSVYND